MSRTKVAVITSLYMYEQGKSATNIAKEEYAGIMASLLLIAKHKKWF